MATAWFVGFVLWPFVTVWLTERTGSFAASFLIVPFAMLLMGLGVWLFTPDHAGKDLDSDRRFDFRQRRMTSSLERLPEPDIRQRR